ncbi:MAG: hypothetical protein KDK51_04455 [Deltaproteobacteria bacterium]|nr:hypothetical protein [Deltaproteobacteria bacterium]
MRLFFCICLLHTFVYAQDLQLDSIGRSFYITEDGNQRFYHDKHDDPNRVLYNIGATQTAYKNIHEIKKRTRVPQSLGETDFYTNYINAKSEFDILTDAVTGNRYYDNPKVKEVQYKGEYHWNIQRFLIFPHFIKFKIEKKQAMLNVTQDVFRYFLYMEKGNRVSAWRETKVFLGQYVEPLINNDYEKWTKEVFPMIYPWYEHRKIDDGDFLLCELDTLYNSGDETHLPDQVLEYNSNVRRQKNFYNEPYKGENRRLISRKELFDALFVYNVLYRKKTIADAKKIAKKSVDGPIKYYQQKIIELQARPLIEEKIIQKADFPDGFYEWDPMMQQTWYQDPRNAARIPIVQQAFTEDDRNQQIEFFRTFRYAD